MKKKGIAPEGRAEVEQYKGFIRILPDPEYSQYDAFYKVKQVFNKLQGKLGNSLSLNKFANMSKIKGMTNDKLAKANYEITYKRIL